MKKSPPVLWVYGNQQLAMDEQVEDLVRSVLPAEERELGYERFAVGDLIKGGDSERLLGEVMQSLESLPFLQQRRILRLDQAELLKAPRGNANSGSSARLFAGVQQFLAQPLEGIYLVLSSSVQRESELSKPLLNACKQIGQVRKFVAYENDQPVDWVRQRALRKGLQVSAPAAVQLIALAGNNLSDLDQELEKLSLLLGRGSTVEIPQLQRFVQGHKHYSVFALSESVARKDLAQALTTLEQQLRENPRETVKLFSLLTSQFRRLLQVHYYWQLSLPENEIFSRLRLHPFLGRQVLQNARRFTVPELERLLLRLTELDLSIKFHNQQVRPLLQDLLQQVCTGTFRHPTPVT